jgi:hypothetical protein
MSAEYIKKAGIFISILTAAIILLIPIVAMAADPPTLVPKTGQTTSYARGDDGNHQTGISSPNPRFTDNGDGTVMDKQTGLVWLKNANCFGTRIWSDAITDSNGLNSGECGLTDGTIEGDWRLPNRFELESLLDLGNNSPALPTGHPFTGVQFYYYWSSTTHVYTDHVWLVTIYDGGVNFYIKTSSHFHVWPVRSDN